MKYLPFICLFILDAIYFSTLIPPKNTLQPGQSLRARPDDTQAPSRRETPGCNSLARVTTYDPTEDSYTRNRQSSTGVRLSSGHCAVDPAIIPYGSKIHIEGWGTFTAVDTGTAVKSRKASGGKLPVIDIFCQSKQEAERLCKSRPLIARYAVIVQQGKL
jgi:3D (Asp-Asp-Asp) domain-containing protein